MLEWKERDWGGKSDAKALIEESTVYSNRNRLEDVNCSPQIYVH